MTEPVPFNDLARHWAPHAARLDAAVLRVVRSGRFLLGPETEAFERDFARFCGVAECAAVGSGTAALELALRALGCDATHEVIVTANAGMYATTATLAVGASPVFADVVPTTLLIDPTSVATLVTERTAAVVATHLYGNVVDVAALRRALPAAIPIVEDGAQAHGARRAGRPVGSLGDAAAFSFYPTKNLGALGDAGAVVSNDPEVVARVRSLRQYGWSERYVAVLAGGTNSRMDEVHAAVLREFLPLVITWNAARAGIRARYLSALADRLVFVGGHDEGSTPATHLCVVRTPERDRLRAALAAEGVSCEVHYPVPDHHQPALQGRGVAPADLTQTERACREVLSLPCFPALEEREVERVIDLVRRWT